jgi:L-lactate dehydrogenase complex protein LldG
MNAILESSELVESFKACAEAVSAQVERVANKEAALDLVVRLLQQEGVNDQPHSGAVWAASPMVSPTDQVILEKTVPGLKFAVTRELAADAKVGISQMDFALAATGSLVQYATEVDKRLVSTLPSTHIALVATGALLPDLPSVISRLDAHNTAYLSFITGPSRTADIERVLTIGAHGPERLVIILVDNLEVAR